MFYKSRLWRIVVVTACAGGFALYAHAQVPTNCVAVNNLPPMTARASAPLDVAISERVVYEVTANDMDTIDEFAPPLPPERIQTHDITCRARAVNVCSMRRDFSSAFRGTDTAWKCMWEVIGAAANAPGVYVDTWQIYNARSDNDPLKDKSVTAYQIVRVHAPVSPDPVPPIMFHVPPQEKDAPNARETAAASLKTKLRRMALGLSLRRINDKSLQVRVDSLPATLRTEATAYVDAVRKEMRANVPGFAMLDDRRGFTLEYDPDTGCIAIQGYAPDGTLWTF